MTSAVSSSSVSPPFVPSRVSSHDGTSDSDFASRFEYFGKMALYYRNKVIGMLPEVARRRLYLQRGFASLGEYAKRVAGLSEEQVALALNLRARLDDKPALKQLFDNGAVSINKLSRVISIATPENECELAEKVQQLSVSALKVMVRDVKMEMSQDSVKANFLDVHKPECESLFSQDGGNGDAVMCDVSLPIDIADTILELRRRGIDVDQMLREMFIRRDEEIKQKKSEIAQELALSRYIPQCVKNILRSEYGTKCTKPRCEKPAEHIHHTARFALTKSHDPHYLAPLCKEHHQIAHAIDVHAVKKRLA